MTAERIEARRALDEVRDELERGVLPAELVVKLAEVARRTVMVPAPLSATEQDLLTEHSGVRPDAAGLATHRFSEAVDDSMLRREALTTAQVAELLGVSASRVRHLIVEGRVYALPSAGRGAPRLMPSWQFRGDRPLPGLAKILRALPPGLSPLTIADFFARAVVEVPGRPTVADWLFSGGAIEPILQLARHVDAAV